MGGDVDGEGGRKGKGKDGRGYDIMFTLEIHVSERWTRVYRILAVSVFSLCSCRDTHPAFDCTPPSHLGTRGSAPCTGRGGERERERGGGGRKRGWE